MKKFATVLLCCTLIAGCGISNTGKGSLIGTAVGAGSGALIGRQMDKKAAEMADVAENDTEAGRAQNRRVEIYISANENMVKAAEAGTLK